MPWINNVYYLAGTLRNSAFRYLEEVMAGISRAQNPRLTEEGWKNFLHQNGLPPISREEYLNRNHRLAAMIPEWNAYHDQVKTVDRTLYHLETSAYNLEYIVRNTVSRLTRDFEKKQEEKLSKLRRTVTDNNVLQKKQREIFAETQAYRRQHFPEEAEMIKLARELRSVNKSYSAKDGEMPSPREKEIFAKLREFCQKYPTQPVPIGVELTINGALRNVGSMEVINTEPGTEVTSLDTLNMLEAQRNNTIRLLKKQRSAVEHFRMSSDLDHAFDYATRDYKLYHYSSLISGLQRWAGIGEDDIWDNQSPVFDRSTQEYAELCAALNAMYEKVRTLYRPLVHDMNEKAVDVSAELERIHKAAEPFRGTKMGEALANLGAPEEEFRKHAQLLSRQDRDAVKNTDTLIVETPEEAKAREADGAAFHLKLNRLMDMAKSYQTEDGTLGVELDLLKERLEGAIDTAQKYATHKATCRLEDLTCAGYSGMFAIKLTLLREAVQPFKGTAMYDEIMALQKPASEYAFAQRVANAEAVFRVAEPRKINYAAPNGPRKVYPENGKAADREYNENEALFRFQAEEAEDAKPDLPAETPELDEYLVEITEYRTRMEKENHFYSWNSKAYDNLVKSLNTLEAAAKANRDAAKDPNQTGRDRFMANAKVQDARREMVACAKAYYTEKLKENKNPTRMARFMLAEQLMGLGDAQAEFTRRHLPAEPKKAPVNPINTESTIDSIRRTLATLEMQDPKHPGRRTDAPMYEFDDQAKAATKVLQALEAKAPETMTDKERTAMPMLRGIVEIQKIFKGEEDAMSRQRDLADPNRQRKGMNLGLELTPTMQRDLILAASLRNVMAKHPAQREQLFASMGTPAKAQEILRTHLQSKDAKLYDKVVDEKKKEQEAEEKAIREAAERGKAQAAKKAGPAK